MYFFDKLRLLELLRQDDVTTYRAADKTTGQDYLFHWLPPDNDPGLARVMNLLNGLDEDARKLIVEVGRRYNRPYLITQNPFPFHDLESWLNALKNFVGAKSLEKKGAWKISAEFNDPKGPPSVPRPASEPGEFTRLMQKLPAPVSAPPAPATDAIISPPAPPPGEFTRLMRQAEPPAPPPAPAPKPAAPAGEFTRMMQANSAPSQPQPQPERVMRPGPKPEAGEFTRLFRLPNTADSGGRTAPPPMSPSPPPPPQPAQPGEFTRMFQSPVGQPTPILPREDPFHQPYQPPGEAPSEFSRNFGSQPQAAPELFSHAGERATQVFARPAPPPEPVPRVPEGPGEYTRMFGAPAAPAGNATPPAPVPVSAPAPASPSAPAPQPHPKSKPDSGLLVFVAILGVLAVCAIGLVVYFALKK